MGPIEVRMIMEKLGTMLIPEQQQQINCKNKVPKKLFREKPNATWDNYFSGDLIMSWLGENGFGATMTCRRDRLPLQIPGEYLQKKTYTSVRAKAARFWKCCCRYVKTRYSKYERLH